MGADAGLRSVRARHHSINQRVHQRCRAASAVFRAVDLSSGSVVRSHSTFGDCCSYVGLAHSAVMKIRRAVYSFFWSRAPFRPGRWVVGQGPLKRKWPAWLSGPPYVYIYIYICIYMYIYIPLLIVFIFSHMMDRSFLFAYWLAYLGAGGHVKH